MSKLVLFLADGTTLDVPLRRERTTIGRRADNDVCLPNLAVSGEHAAVVTILADSFLEDLGSTNGTLVNGQPVAKHFLRDGDQIDVGRHMLVYCVDDDAVLAADFLRSSVRTSASDLGELVEPARPFVRDAREADGGAMRRDRIAENAADALTRTSRLAAAQLGGLPADLATRAAPKPAPVASVKVLSGPNAGRAIPLTKDQTTVGRAGVQVALIHRSGALFKLKPVEGERPPLVNGNALSGEGSALAPGDVIEIAGAKLEFLGLPQVVDSG